MCRSYANSTNNKRHCLFKIFAELLIFFCGLFLDNRQSQQNCEKIFLILPSLRCIKYLFFGRSAVYTLVFCDDILFGWFLLIILGIDLWNMIGIFHEKNMNLWLVRWRALKEPVFVKNWKVSCSGIVWEPKLLFVGPCIRCCYLCFRLIWYYRAYEGL